MLTGPHAATGSTGTVHHVVRGVVGTAHRGVLAPAVACGGRTVVMSMLPGSS